MSGMQHIVLVFIDGLGLGDPTSPNNPCRIPELDLLANFRPERWTPPPDGGRPDSLPEIVRDRALPKNGIVRATDVSMGVVGLPQSATGQTALFTGKNASAVLGRHMYGYPTATLQRILLEHSILKTMVDSGRAALFANAFRPLFFELGDTVWKRSMSASSWANRAAGLRFRNVEDLLAGEAVYQDITHDSPGPRGMGLPERQPEDAGRILASLGARHTFTLFEFFQTDKAGHMRDRAKAERELLKLERFLSALVANLDLETSTLIVTSDHGNVEDLSTKSHTHNPVPTLVFGEGAQELAARMDRLEDFTPIMLGALGVPRNPVP